MKDSFFNPPATNFSLSLYYYLPYVLISPSPLLIFPPCTNISPPLPLLPPLSLSQRSLKEGALRAQGIIDRAGRARRWAPPEGQGLGLGAEQGQGLGSEPGQEQEQGVVDEDNIDRMALPPLTPTSSSIQVAWRMTM